MRKQTKLVAVLSTAALLAIGASMTSFAATGWAEEDGTWVYYNRDGERATEKWAKSGNNWYYLDDSGEMAVDQLIEDGDNFYYVDVNGVMVANQWVAIDNEDSGQDNEPDQWWYYFQANGKALKGPDDGKVALKTINGKKYAFNDEGQMLYGWIKEDDQSIYNDDDDAWQDGVYYFGSPDDGAMTVGWLLMDITDDDAEGNNQKWIAPTFTDDDDQSRWFYFKSNGKKVEASSADEVKERTINGKKYGFDQFGRMVAEWSYDSDGNGGVASLGSATTTPDDKTATTSSSRVQTVRQTHQWKYFNSVEDGQKLSKGWFKVVAAEYLDEDKYDDDEDKWYYADGKGYLYANSMETIKGKKYAFDQHGRMLDGMHFIKGTNNYFTAIANDDDTSHYGPFDTEDDFDLNAHLYVENGYKFYYFGDSSDGAMKTGKTTVEIDGDKFTFNFGTSGSQKGVGKVGEDDKKYYSSGKLMTAGSDEKFQVISPWLYTDSGNLKVSGYYKYEDAAVFSGVTTWSGMPSSWRIDTLSLSDVKTAFDSNNDGNYDASATMTVSGKPVTVKLSDLGISPSKLSNDKISDLTIYFFSNDSGATYTLGLPNLKNNGFGVVNTSGKVSEKNAKNKDGNDVYYKVTGGKIVATYTED